MTLSVLTLVLSRADSDTVWIQLLDELCNDCPYSQMRVAAIGLVKKSITEALQSEQTVRMTFPSIAFEREKINYI